MQLPQELNNLVITNSYIGKKRDKFIARQAEIKLLNGIVSKNKASIVIAYGRRRVGKTALIEYYFKDRALLKFEGVQGKDKQYQINKVLFQLSTYTNFPLLTELNYTNWGQFFNLLASLTTKGVFTIYFEELQWLAEYDEEFVSELKYYWDNNFNQNDQLIIVLCGSSPSFMVNQVIHSAALHNRSEHVIVLRPLSVKETAEFLNSDADTNTNSGSIYSNKEIFDAYLSVGGIPEYLNYLKLESSTFLAICKQSFVESGFFFNEEDKIFLSSLAKDPLYREIIRALAHNKSLTRNEIVSELNIESGNTLTKLLLDLEQCGFVDKYYPYTSTDDGLLFRYCVSDYFLNFFYKFIKANTTSIKQGRYKENPTTALDLREYNQWLGYAFERYCRHNAHQIADLLGFGAVRYRSGALFKRGVRKDASTTKSESRSKGKVKDQSKIKTVYGAQIDLVFEREDRVNTVCEIKYSNVLIDTEVIEEFEKKIKAVPPKKNYRLQKVLITALGATEALIKRNYFDRVVTIEELM